MFRFDLNKKWLYIAFFFALFSCNELEYRSKFVLNHKKETCQITSPDSQIFIEKNLHAPRGISYSKSRGIIYPTYGSSIEISSLWTRYNFSKKSIVDKNSENWDLAFKGTMIIVNGGSSDKDNISRTKKVRLALVEKEFSKVTDIPPASEFYRDGEYNMYALPLESGDGWYRDSDSFLFAIHPIENRTLIIKTHDNKYVKMKIESYYKDEVQPTFINIFTRKSGFYTFKFQFANKKGKFE